MSDAVILLEKSSVVLVPGGQSEVENEILTEVVIQREGIPGPPGLQGPPGPAGPSGFASTFTWSPPDVQSIWNITHNLGRYPSVTVVDSQGREFKGDIIYLNDNLLSIEFTVPISGTAYLN